MLSRRAASARLPPQRRERAADHCPLRVCAIAAGRSPASQSAASVARVRDREKPRSSAWMTSPRTSTLARSMTLLSSRTLPGQAMAQQPRGRRRR